MKRATAKATATTRVTVTATTRDITMRTARIINGLLLKKGLEEF